ncbi:MAG: helix-hairpin-helix domain-containing protein [Candidatus Omnitrophica bacterium]|nr:helix-hairpin-helix domain-containing protein [Candidatus Omnitrophota bacterium]
MSRTEKVVTITLIFAVFCIVAVSYYAKSTGKRFEIAGAGETEAARVAIAGQRIVDINTASRFQLTRLPGIGPNFAQRIIDYRRENGDFGLPEDIMKVKGIGPKKYEKIKDRIRTGQQ